MEGNMTATCAWCGDPAVTDVITQTGKKHRKTAPVCEDHAQDFESRGMTTVRQEQEKRAQGHIRNRAMVEQLRRTMGD